ncbi:MAG TPA: L-threonylcarbamoyladenylate synthase [Chloroflexota bacterium]|nr:L-threonylcarbamoyladenylate synthase [Chloroflexota bacterium]
MLSADAFGVAEAAAILRSGGLVAFPTETVYGLGANALDTTAVRGIFEAKERPADDPLIVHLGDATELSRVAVANAASELLGARFWPGPLTVVLLKQPRVPAEVTAGLDTVAVRVPAHPVARELLRATGLPVAAPSANRFGRPSPTRARHVLNDLDGRIDAVIEGGPANVGVESTIVDVASATPRLLRPGGLPAEEIEEVLGVALLPQGPAGLGPQAAPGLLPVHYAPRTALTLIVGPSPSARVRLIHEVQLALSQAQRVGVLALDDDVSCLPQGARLEIVGQWSDPATTAQRLFDAVRALDAASLDIIYARDLADPTLGLGRALADRLRRASRRIIDSRA